jgi:uncharacterized protein
VKIAVDRLTASPQAFDFEAGTAWWRSVVPADRALPAELDEPLRVGVSAYRVGEDLLIQGEIRGGLPLECGRCLARYRHTLREPFRLVLEPAGLREPSDPEGADALARYGMCLAEELEAGWYRGSEIDLARFVHEAVCLSLPVKPLCREECAGLCPRCGADRNAGPCGCPDEPGDSPFAALRALRDGTGGGRS